VPQACALAWARRLKHASVFVVLLVCDNFLTVASDANKLTQPQFCDQRMKNNLSNQKHAVLLVYKSEFKDGFASY
jgi:hypothetical protein